MLSIAGLFSIASWKLGVAFVVCSIAYIVYYYFYSCKYLMKVLGAYQIEKKDNPTLYNIVEELSIAAGIPVPKIYICDDLIPNAFATGYDPQHASIAITAGLLEIMNEKELRGVVGHELSHIRNYDIRLTTVLCSLDRIIFNCGVYLIVAVLGMLYSLFEGEFSIAKIVIFVFVAPVALFFGVPIAFIGIPLSKILYIFFSKEREYLADVGSIDLTRDGSNIIGALQKLERYDEIIEEKGVDTDYFYNDTLVSGLALNVNKPKNWLKSLVSDHPPLNKRIKRLKESAN
ncbi:MAG: M48 family metallopeptidase [Lactobacillus sp.]|nr:M48 family metallopeptidase [Lactobacillus sp.]